MSTVALSKHTNIAFVSVTDTVLPTPLNSPGVVSVIFLFYWNFLPHLLLNRNAKGNQLSPVNCHVHMTSPFPSLSITVFHHFKAFSHLLLFLSAPLGSSIFLFSYNPFVCHVYCINPTHNAGSFLSLGSASFGLRKRSFHLCSSGGLPTRSITFGIHPASAALSFVQQLFSSQRSNVFSTLLTQCYKTALTCKKTDGWSREMWPQRPRIRADLADDVYYTARKIPKCIGRGFQMEEA